MYPFLRLSLAMWPCLDWCSMQSFCLGLCSAGITYLIRLCDGRDYKVEARDRSPNLKSRLGLSTLHSPLISI